MTYNKFKDAPPEKTIERIKESFSKIGIHLKHRVYKRMDGIYSCIVMDEVGGWATAGKGTDELYCLASGYAEAMEHFCNYCAYDLSSISQDVHKYLNFFRYPDEKMVAMNQLEAIDEMVLKEMKLAYTMEEDLYSEEKLIDTWSEFLKTDKISLVPYYSVKKKEIVYLPEAIIGKLCGSTGGGAGNTVEEAIGHGLDEISERYVKYIIYSQELTPPEIPRKYIECMCPEIFQLIKNIENRGKFKVLVMDASLGKNYPVVSVCLIDIYEHSYVINFGAHPCFQIALERCLTEMFQFMTLNHEKSVKHKNFEKWTSYAKDVHSIRNWVSLLRDDTGRVADAFFSDTPSWEFKPWGIYNNYDNKYGMRLQLNNFIQNGVEDIYIRNFSFLGFPVYRIYIPEYSTSHYTICDRIFNNYKEGKQIIESIINESRQEISLLENKTLRDVFSNESYIDSWIIRDIKESFLDLLYASLIKDANGNREAIELIQNIKEDFAEAILEEQNMARKHYEENFRDKILSLFYDDFVSEIIVAWRNENSFVKLCLLLKKYRLIASNNKDKEYKEELQIIHQKFKYIMLNNIPNQMEVKKYLD